MLIRAFLFWLPMIPIAVLNGILRESVYAKWMPELRAHQVSTLIAALLMGAYIVLVYPGLHPASASGAGMVGLLWIALTVAFEFLFGRLVAGHSWARLLRDYDLAAGRVWLLFLLWIGVAPVLLYALRGPA